MLTQEVVIKDRTVHIIGAGPAGLTAAIHLAKLGYSPIVYEQHVDVGARFHGDFQGIENWTSKEDARHFLERMGIDINFSFTPFAQGVFFDPAMAPHNIQTKRPLFYMIERGQGPHSLDQGLKQQALAAGVRFGWNKRMEHISAEHVIVGIGPKAADVVARGIVFETNHKDAYFGFLDNHIAPQGYAYLLIHNGRATLATCMFDKFKNSRDYFDRAYEKLKQAVPIVVKNPHHFSGYGNYFLQPHPRQGSRLFVGESAGFQDALWGFGLRYAMLSGYLAAVSITTGQNYNELCRDHIAPVMKTSLANRWLYAHLGNKGYGKMLGRLTPADDVIKILHNQHQFSTFKKIIYRLAKRRYHSRLVDNRCVEPECDCVWCRCKRLQQKDAFDLQHPSRTKLEAA